MTTETELWPVPGNALAVTAPVDTDAAHRVIRIVGSRPASETFTIEPMLTLGDYRSHLWDDGWTVVTNDGSRCAQFEQSLVVTADGAEVLTVP